MISDNVQQKARKLAKDGGVIHFSYATNGVRGIVEGSGSMYHHPHIDFSGRYFCGCKGFYYNDVCSHLVALIESIPLDQTQEVARQVLLGNMSKQKQDLYVETKLEAFNDIMGNMAIPGGVPLKSGLTLVGRPQAGKTIFSFQCCFEVMKAMAEDEDGNYDADHDGNYNSMIVDTEGSRHTYHFLLDTFKTRFGLDVEIVEVDVEIRGNIAKFNYDKDIEADHLIYLLDVRGLEDILTMHGRPANIITEGSKMKIEPSGKHVGAFESSIGQFANGHDICYTAYDSLTNPIENRFTINRYDWPVRAKATQWWIGQVQEMAQKMDMAQIYTTHLSEDPTDGDDDDPGYVGGKALEHNTKHTLLIQQAQDTERKIELMRHPGKSTEVGDREKRFINLSSGEGFVDIDE